MKRRLIKVPVLTWTFLVVCGYNIYQILYPNEPVCEPYKADEESSVIVFTRIAQTANNTIFNSHFKMVRRQFKHAVDLNVEGASFIEYFLDQNGQRMNDEWEDGFADTMYTANPVLSMLEMITGSFSTISDQSLFVYMSDCLFDMQHNVSSILRERIDADYHGLYCLNGVNDENSCNNDYFAFNYKTAQSMRRKLLNSRNSNSPEYINMLDEITVSRNVNQFGRNGTSSVVSAFFNNGHSLLTAQKYNLSPAIAVYCKLTIYVDIIAFASRFNVPRTKGLQPRYQENQIQPLLRYLKRPMSSCANGDLVVFVKCARSEQFQRNWIRHYAREMAKSGGFEMDLIFLLGSGKDQYKAVLDQEADDHNDILIGGFIDTYDNLPIKTYLGYQYFAEFCSTKKYVIFQDSDAFTLLDEIMVDFRRDEAKATSKLPWESPKFQDAALYCIKGKTLPFRSLATEPSFPDFGQHYMSKWFYWLDAIDPAYELPTYCNGNCNALTGKAALRIWEQAQNTDRQGFRIEDLYFLGFMREKAELNGKSLGAFVQIKIIRRENEGVRRDRNERL